MRIHLDGVVGAEPLRGCRGRAPKQSPYIFFYNIIKIKTILYYINEFSEIVYDYIAYAGYLFNNDGD